MIITRFFADWLVVQGNEHKEFFFIIKRFQNLVNSPLQLPAKIKMRVNLEYSSIFSLKTVSLLKM
jgi:hypothetical protein